MIRETRFDVLAEESGQRLEVFLHARTDCDRAFCREAVESGQVLVNGQPCLRASSSARSTP
jgi:ribosomal 50S subunit-recycling heat shock protein